MSFKPVLIAPFKTGLDTDIEPWLAPPDSFRKLDNIHIRHGYLQKRLGYRLFGELTKLGDATDAVMGITQYIKSDGTKTTLAFNRRRAYSFNSGTYVFLELDGANIFSGDEYDFVWSANWQSGGGTNRLYFTNGKSGTPVAAPTLDGIRYYDEAVSLTNTKEFNPTLNATDLLVGAKLIFSLGQRLVVLNTEESTSGAAANNRPQRARWCAKQNPDDWNDVTAGGGGFADAATGDQIVSARALQNQIIVFFTNSVWKLVPTPDPNRAFKWQKINSFRACDGKMATTGYDRYVLAYGVRGATATDGVETRRIDQKITDFTVDEINVAEFQKVFCERSYANTRSWTLYNDTATVSNENNKALIIDEDSSAFSTYSIDINCLGHGNLTKDYALDDFTVANDLDLSLNDFGDETLFSYFWQDNQEIFLGGDVDGNIYVMETDGDDNGSSISSTFTTNAWNPFQEQGREAQLSYIDLYIDTDVKTIGILEFYKDTDSAPYTSQSFDFLPNLDFISTIVNATTTNPVNINSPKHGRTTGDNIYIYGVDGMTDVNSGEAGGEYTVTVVDGNNFTLDGIDGTAFSEYTSGGAIYLRQFYRTKTWKRVYGGGIGFEHRIKYTSTGIDKPFRILGYKPYFKPRGDRTIN